MPVRELSLSLHDACAAAFFPTSAGEGKSHRVCQPRLLPSKQGSSVSFTVEVDSCASLQCLSGCLPTSQSGPREWLGPQRCREGKERQYTSVAEGQEQPPLSVPGLLSPDEMTL